MPLKIQQDETPALNLTPMIDVVFLLIVFFMVATKFSELERDIELHLPEVANAESLSTAPKMAEIAVHADGRISLDGQTLTLAQLTPRLAEARDANPALSAVIRGDAACPYQHVAAALAACKEARVRDISVSVQLAEGAAATRL